MPDPTMRDVFLAIKKIREEMPSMAYLLDIPEVAPLIIKLASGEIDQQKFETDLYKTRFWRNTSDFQRQWRAQVAIDPAKARAQRQQMAERVGDLARQMGVRLPSGNRIRATGYRAGREGGYEVTGGNAFARVADLALYNGWNEDQITNYLLQFATVGQEGRNPTGGLAVGMAQIRRLEEQYGVSGRDRDRFRVARQVLNGRETLESYEEKLRRRAIATYGGSEDVKGVLERGGTVEEWFDPYRRMIAQELEIPDAEISMNNRRWRNILLHNDGTRTRSMTMDEAMTYVRGQAEYAQTRGGREKEAAMVNNLLTVFGKRA